MALTRSPSTFLRLAGLAIGISIAGNLAVARAQTEELPPVSAPDPYLEQLLGRGASNDDLLVADAVAKLVRVGLWGEADQILARAATRQRDDQTAAAMARLIGADLLVRMRQSPELNEPAKKLLGELSEALTRETVAPGRLRAAIDDLDSPVIDRQLAAIRVLYSGDQAAISELVAAIVSDSPTADRETLLRALIKLNDRNIEPLQRLAIYGTPSVREHALEALAKFDRQRFLPEFVTALFAEDATERERSLAQRTLQRMDINVASSDEAIAYLKDRLRVASERIEMADPQVIVPISVVNADQTSVSVVRVQEVVAREHERADFAARLRRVGATDAASLSTSLIADLSYRITANPLWGSASEVQAIQQAYPALTDPSLVTASLSTATKQGEWRAVLALLQVIKAVANQEESQQWLQGTGGGAAPLVQLTLAPQPRVRYEAAEAISMLQVETFAGVTNYRRTLAEMSRLSSKPTLVVLETIPEILQRIYSFAGELGLQVDAVTTISELERRLALGGDIRLVLAMATPADGRPIDLIDRVRRIDRVGQVPILFYGDEPATLESHALTAPTAQIPQPVTPIPIRNFLIEARLEAEVPPLIEGERAYFRSIALEALTKANQLVQ